MSRRNVKKIGRQVTKPNIYRIKKKSQSEKEWDRYSDTIAFIAGEDDYTTELFVSAWVEGPEKPIQ